ncbi:helix-turn-helix domain-containing protein [Chitinophaga filiformis]|uniref:Helix-turn-helix domain-containing protein n=1 Tax=Chitinophaga filiformis TaxID=104663 RepID=A0A1G7VJ18_CHIFI|nr:AraC family transcriptional regulator [Chitinophaga filiformis]SDG59399.1 Helix-turn-helix domain-containing protein [Chitinophaga filiformis]
MIFKEIIPGLKLQPYIKCFYYYESDSDSSYDDIVFPSGTMEVIFNLGAGNWKSKTDDTFYTTPPIELWGQITKPLAIQSVGRNIMLGFKFYPHSAAYFFNEHVSEFNNKIVDAVDALGPSLKTLHDKLLETRKLESRIALLEDYLWQKLAASEKRHNKIKFVGDIVHYLKKNYSEDNIVSLSHRHNISTRYLNMLFSQYTGLAPKLFYKINRFQHSLNLISQSEEKLTSIAYSSGYFDQAHFIKEFKLFTGVTPNTFAKQASPINQVLAAS